MKKIIASLIIGLIIFSGCGEGGLYEGEEQKYYIADLVGDPNNRNIFRATTVWSEDASFEVLIPDYWEVNVDEEDEYNTDVYLTSNEYKDGSCVLLAGTRGYGLDPSYEKDLWYTTVPWGAADDYFFYERIDEETREPVVRIVEFQDADENFYIFELRFPEEDYYACNEDFSNMLTTFNTLDLPLEDTYIEKEIFEPKWQTFAFLNNNITEQRFVVDIPPTYMSDDDEGTDYLYNESNDCRMYAGVADRDLEEAASYEEDVFVFDNNDMGEKILLSDEEGNVYMEVITVEHDLLTYNFELRNYDAACVEDFESTVSSFRTYEEHVASKQGYNIFDNADETTEVEEETQL